MNRGGLAITVDKQKLLEVIRTGQSKMSEVYRSETSLIYRVDVRKIERPYFLLVESDCTSDEDYRAFQEVMDCTDWRCGVLETDVYTTPHPQLPWSEGFSVHVVYPCEGP